MVNGERTRADDDQHQNAERAELRVGQSLADGPDEMPEGEEELEHCLCLFAQSPAFFNSSCKAVSRLFSWRICAMRAFHLTPSPICS